MSDTKASETNEIEADSLLSSDMKSTISNCDEITTNEKELEQDNNDVLPSKDEACNLSENGHNEEPNSEPKEDNSEKDYLKIPEDDISPKAENNDSLEETKCSEDSNSLVGQDITPNNDTNNDCSMETDSKQETEESVDPKESQYADDNHIDSVESVTESVNGKSVDEEASLNEQSSMSAENVDVRSEGLESSQEEPESLEKESEEGSAEEPLALESSQEMEQDESKESTMDLDHDDTLDSSDTKTSSLSKASSNVITEVVVGNNDEVTLDLTKTLLNGEKDKDLSSAKQDSQDDSTGSQSLKRDHSSSSGSVAEDLSLPSKRQNVANGLGALNGTLSNEEDDDDEDDDEDDSDNYDELLMPPTPPLDDVDDFERTGKVSLFHKLKQQLLNEDAKLILLKKIRQSQLKEHISQQKSSHNSASTGSNSAQSTGSMGVNLTSNLRDVNNLNLLGLSQNSLGLERANQYQASLSQSGINAALNFSTSHNSKSASNMINNNVAHSNNHPTLFGKNNLPNLNLAHQPMQAHLPKGMSHGKGNSVLSSPFASTLRSPYNHLNSHLSAPPPSLHGSSSNSTKQRSSYDAPNLNTAHSSHRSSSSAPLNRSSMATPPNLGYSDLRQSSASSKFNQHISQSASPSPTVHNQIAESTRADPLIAQRQAANVKQVLRKQLEKMPQPKVPPPEMHFIPNPNNAEFICYIGLEKVVDYLTGNNQVFHPPEPFECVQCGTDFTPVWKWKDRTDPSKPSVICEKCVSKNMKKVVTDEQTKRINTFSKAYEELEKQMATAAATASTITPPTAAISPALNSSSVTSASPAQHAPSSTLASHSSSSTSTHNMFSSSNNNAATVAAVAAAAANFGSLGAGLSGLQHQQAHSNSPLSSLTAQQVAAMAASFLPHTTSSSAAHQQMSTPPAAHSSSRSTSNSFASNLAAAFGAPNSNAQSAAATLALLQQLPKVNSQQTQSLLLAQQLQAFSALAGGGNTAANANNAAMAQLLGFPNLFYSSLLAATIANQKSSNQAASANSNLNAAAAAALQRQLLMDILPGASGNSRSGHSSTSNSSMPHHNWKS